MRDKVLNTAFNIIVERDMASQTIDEIAKKNITITTSGVCNDAALSCALDSMGSENVMFSIDYPFESTEIAVNWLKTADITDQERNAVAWGNATSILHLGA